MNRRDYGDRHGAPRPPRDIEEELEAAHDDPVRFGIAQARYEAWLTDQGYEVITRGRPPRADKAAQ